MSEDSGGVISLDLIINSRIEEQLNKAVSLARGPAEKIGEQINRSVSKSIDNIGKAVNVAVGSTEKSVSADVENAVARYLEREEQRRKAILNAANSIPEKVISSSGKYMRDYMEYNTDEIMKQVDEFAEAIDKPVEETVEKANKKLAELGDFDVSSDPIGRLQQELDLAYEKMELLQNKRREIFNSDPADKPSDKTKSRLNAIQRQIISTQSSIDKLEKNFSSAAATTDEALSAEERYAEKTEQINTHTSEVKKKCESEFAAFKEKNLAKIAATEKRGAARLRTLIQKTAARIGSVFDKTFKAVGSAGKRALIKLKSGFEKLLSPIKKLGKALKSSFKSVFLFAGLYAAFRAIKDGLSEAAKADEKFMQSLNSVKANLSIAFTPILQAIMPALNTLMSGLANAARSIAAFTAGVFGTTYKKAAEASKKLKSVSDAAKKAKLSAAGIDEMNILSNADSQSSESNGIDYDSIDMSEPKLPDWAERLKDSIRSGDWAGVGSILAERLNAALSSIDWDSVQIKINNGVKKLTDGISGFLNTVDWNTVGDTLAGGINTAFGAVYTFFDGINWSKLGSDIAGGLNRAVKKTNWKLVGRTLGKQIQSAIDTAHGFVTKFDWYEFGASLGDSVNSMIGSIDFTKAAETLSKSIEGVLDTAIGFIQTIDWEQFSDKVYDFIGGIDWGGIASKIFELLGSALAVYVTNLWGSIDKVVTSIRDYFSEKIEECGGDIIDGLWKGIKDAVSGALKWIHDNIFKPFIDGFKKCFGIHSPSTVMAEMGGYIIEGLCGAISDGIENVRELFSDMLEKIHAVFSDVGDWFGEKFGGAWDKVKGAFSNTKSWFGERWDDIKEAFSDTDSWFGEKFQIAYDNVTERWSGLKGFFDGLWEDISDGAKEGINLIIDKINGLLGVVESAVNSMIEGLNTISFEIPDWAPGGGKKFGLDFNKIDIPEVPHLASGGLATAPTLAMVGDNRNAKSDPEVIAPLSKLSGMIGNNSEIIELLKIIVELLRSGTSIELVTYLFKGSNEFSREVIKAVANERARRGGTL